MSDWPGPLKPFEKWLYPSMVLWVAAFMWLAFEVWPNHPFVSTFDTIVAAFLTFGAAVTGIVSLILSRRP